jgi:hypothetical protein
VERMRGRPKRRMMRRLGKVEENAAKKEVERMRRRKWKMERLMRRKMIEFNRKDKKKRQENRKYGKVEKKGIEKGKGGGTG